MRGIDLKEKSAKDTGDAELLREVADHGPTLHQIVFAHLKAHCEGKTGRNLCPIVGLTREGFCAATMEACPHDARQPSASDLVEEAAPAPAKAPAGKK